MSAHQVSSYKAGVTSWGTRTDRQIHGRGYFDCNAKESSVSLRVGERKALDGVTVDVKIGTPTHPHRLSRSSWIRINTGWRRRCEYFLQV